MQVGSFGILFWQDKVTEISYAHLSTGLAGFTVKEQIGTAAATTKNYLYRKNVLGDVDAIYDTDMSLVGEYIYDAWGNCTIEATGTDNYAVMQLNPFRLQRLLLGQRTEPVLPANPLLRPRNRQIHKRGRH